MERRDKMSLRQLLAASFLSLLSPAVRQLSGAPVRAAGAASWLCPAAAAVPAALYAVMLAAFLKNRTPGEGMAELFCRSIGAVPGRAVCVIFGLWQVFYCGFLLRSSAERLVSSVYEYGSDTFFIIITLAVSLTAALGSFRYLGRTAEALLPVMALLLAFVLLTSLGDISAENLTPVSVLDTGNVLIGAFPLLNMTTFLADFMFLAGRTEPEDGEMRKSALWALLLMLCMLLLQVCVVGTLSAKLTERLQHPFFIMVRNCRLFGVVERFEAIVVAVWACTDFVFLALLLMSSSEIFRGVSGAEKRYPFVFACAAAAVFVSAFCAENAFDLKKAAETSVPAANACLKFAVLPAVLCVGKLRKRI